MSWHYTPEKIDARVAELGKHIIRERVAIAGLALVRSAASQERGDGRAIKAGDTYKAVDEVVRFAARLTVPDGWDGGKIFLGLKFLGAESLVRIDGDAVQAIDHQHHNLLLADPARCGRIHELVIESYTGTIDAQNRGGWSGAGGLKVQDGHVNVLLETAELQLIDRDAEGLYYDLLVAKDAAKQLDPNDREYSVILNILDRAVDMLDTTFGAGTPAYYESAKAVREFVQAELYGKLTAGNLAPVSWSVGHAHIDTAWLWPLRHTRHKVGRTFTTAVNLMKQYPEYIFTCSQPQQYAYLKEDYPDVFEKVKEAVANGQWEPVGGMWVESDCNVISGESLVRQFLYGQRFFEREFGFHTDVVWLPDVFGYAASFPQIIKKSGMKYFMTIKISWSQINKPLYQTFKWEGIDGTSVLTHFSPNGNYNACMDALDVKHNWNSYKQKHVSDSVLYIYGYGDGGGGPTREMLEQAQRMKDFPGVPKVKLATNQSFFEDLEKQVAGNRMLPRWVGELYLEYHRGTYTSQARNKRYNRLSEIALQTAEQLSSIGQTLAGTAYPQAELTKAWELTLLNQFHDIIPGSSIAEVYEESTRDYESVLAAASNASAFALDAVAFQVATPAGNVVIYNPLSWTRSDVAEVDPDLGLAGQDITNLDGESKTLVALDAVPSLGYSTVTPGVIGETQGQVTANIDSLDNDFFNIVLDENGEIDSIIDKRSGREVLDRKQYCKGNALLTFEDKPLMYDAWDIDIFYQDKMTPVTQVESISVVENGPIRASVEIVRNFGRGSRIRQRISVYAHLPRIDFDTEVEWVERQVLLKAAFPVNVLSPRATYDIQFGNVERPTHWNTTWDWARFETCGHKWADLSEGDYGVSILSDCKYGWDIKGNVMRLTLLKSANDPDPLADLGRHRFTYSLLPHVGDWRSGETIRRAYELNVPVKTAIAGNCGMLPEALSFASVSEPNLIVETIKKAEDDDSLIVRLYEAFGQRGNATLDFAHPLASAVEVNLMERESDESRANVIVIGDAFIGFSYLPYEIKTYKVRLK